MYIPVDVHVSPSRPHICPSGQHSLFSKQSAKIMKFLSKIYHLPYGPRRKKTCFRRFAINTAADQPAHPRSLISVFVIHYLESIICKLAIGKISIIQLVSVAEETGLKLASTETPKTGFIASRTICCRLICGNNQ